MRRTRLLYGSDKMVLHRRCPTGIDHTAAIVQLSPSHNWGATACIKALTRRLGFGVLLLPLVIILAYALHRGHRTLPVWYVAASATTLVLGAGAFTMALVDHIRDRRGPDRYFYPRPATGEDLPPSARWSGTIIAAIGTGPLLVVSDRYQALWWIKGGAVGFALGLMWILVDVIRATARHLRARSRRRRQLT
jgi:hypothetical protein